MTETLGEQFKKCIEKGRPLAKEIGLINDYITFLYGNGRYLVFRVDEIYMDGYMSGGVYYPFNIPFMVPTFTLLQAIKDKGESTVMYEINEQLIDKKNIN